MSQNQVGKKYLFLKIIFFIIYFGDSLFYSYTALFLNSLGYGEGIIGTIGSITTIVYMVANPLWTLFARNSKTIKWLMSVIAVMAGVFILCYANVSTQEKIMILTGMLALFMAPFYTFLDGHAVSFCKENNKQYSNVRIMGSIAYIFGSAIGGFMIDALGFSNVFMIASIFFILAGILITFIKPVSSKPEEENRERNIKNILTNKWFFLYVIFYLFTVSTNVLGDGFVSLLFCNEKGLSTASYGWIGAGIIVTEVVTLLVLGLFFRNKKELYLLAFSGGAYFLRSIILSFTGLPIPILIAASTLRGVAWGTMLFVHMKYLMKLVGIENVTSAALVLVSFSSLFQFLGSNALGYIIQFLGYSTAYQIIAVLSFASCCIFITSRAFYEKKHDK